MARFAIADIGIPDYFLANIRFFNPVIAVAIILIRRFSPALAT
jgi:hypothetical protein